MSDAFTFWLTKYLVDALVFLGALALIVLVTTLCERTIARRNRKPKT